MINVEPRTWARICWIALIIAWLFAGLLAYRGTISWWLAGVIGMVLGGIGTEVSKRAKEYAEIAALAAERNVIRSDT